jgi:caffeoyl-CoA O-methyltransferase
MGSGFGYSTAWFAMAVRDEGGGEVHHVVWDDALSSAARGHLERMALTPYVRYHVGEAVETLRARADAFDAIFCDIDKPGYPAALPVMRERLRPGGLLLVDNMLWSGRVWDDAHQEASTRGVRELTRLLIADDAFATTLLPLRDGVAVAWKKT